MRIPRSKPAIARPVPRPATAELPMEWDCAYELAVEDVRTVGLAVTDEARGLLTDEAIGLLTDEDDEDISAVLGEFDVDEGIHFTIRCFTSNDSVASPAVYVGTETGIHVTKVIIAAGIIVDVGDPAG